MSDEFYDRLREEQARKTKKDDLIKKELERRSNDSILVHNPTSKDYYDKYGGNYWLIPKKDKDIGYGKGCAVVLRYIAMHYLKHMTDQLIHAESKPLEEAAKKKYTGSHWPGEQERVALKTNNPLLREKYARIIWKGLHKKFGLDEIPHVEERRPELKASQPLDSQIVEKIEMGIPEEGKAPPPKKLIKNIPLGTKAPNKDEVKKEDFAKQIE